MATTPITRQELEAMKANPQSADTARLVEFAEQAMGLIESAKIMIAASISADRKEWVKALDGLGDALARIQGQEPEPRS